MEDEIAVADEVSQKAARPLMQWLGVFAVVALLLGLWSYFFGPTKEERARRAAVYAQLDAERACSNATATALAKTQEFIEPMLKAPLTAKFPSADHKDVSVMYVGDCTHDVRAFVDSQNSFGAMIRTKYRAKVQKAKDGWKVIETDFQ